jgi:hypothetical protein
MQAGPDADVGGRPGPPCRGVGPACIFTPKGHQTAGCLFRLSLYNINAPASHPRRIIYTEKQKLPSCQPKQEKLCIFA